MTPAIEHSVLVAGTSFRQADVATARFGDACDLVHEPSNQHDPEAIMVVLRKNGRQIGYLPRGLGGTILEVLGLGASVAGIVNSVGKAGGSGPLGVNMTIQMYGPPERDGDAA